MTEFTLILFPEGRAIISTNAELSQRAAHEVREAFGRWRDTPEGILVLSHCEVERATTIELDIPEPVPA